MAQKRKIPNIADDVIDLSQWNQDDLNNLTNTLVPTREHSLVQYLTVTTVPIEDNIRYVHVTSLSLVQNINVDVLLEWLPYLQKVYRDAESLALLCRNTLPYVKDAPTNAYMDMVKFLSLSESASKRLVKIVSALPTLPSTPRELNEAAEDLLLYYSELRVFLLTKAHLILCTNWTILSKDNSNVVDGNLI